VAQYRAEILTIFCSYFRRNVDFINSFWNLLTFIAGISQKNPDQSEFGPKNEDITFLMQDEEGVENPLMQIIRKYFGKTRTNSKQMRNSPMMIKLLKKEL
jgi:hypothetical protein